MSSDDNAADFVLGSLGAVQRDMVARKRLYQKDLDGRICALEELLSALTPSEVFAGPQSDLWQQICNVLTHQPCGIAEGSFACLGGLWEYHSPGIECKELWSDKALLIRCEPGASEERHPQPDGEDEHIIIIAGDLMLGGRTFAVGDYVQIPAGADHPDMRTLTGCLLFTQYKVATQS
jgi:hypothetical protein